MTFTIGVSIGIASVGFAGVDFGQKTILFSGAHMFEPAEDARDGSTPAARRREKRRVRRTISRRAQRKKQIRALLSSHNIDTACIDKSKTQGLILSPWDLRKAALERPLEDGEFARVLFHIAKHRGYQPNSKNKLVEGNNSNSDKILAAASALELRAKKSKQKTIAAYLATTPKQRNSEANFDHSIIRDSIRKEVSAIFDAQRRFHNDKATVELEKAFAGCGDISKRHNLEGDGIAFYQRSFAGPEDSVGNCLFEQGEKRASKRSYSAELFIIWNKLHKVQIWKSSIDRRNLHQEEKEKLIKLAHQNKHGITYEQARKTLGLNKEEFFGIYYTRDFEHTLQRATIKKDEDDVFLELPGYQKIKEALYPTKGDYWSEWLAENTHLLDEIVRILSFHTHNEIDELLSQLGFNNQEVSRLKNIEYSADTIELSNKALHKLLPILKKGTSYDAACQLIWETRQSKSNSLIPPFEQSTNFVINRSFAHARKIINACIRRYGMPENIVITLEPTLNKSFDKRRALKKELKTEELLKIQIQRKLSKEFKIPVKDITDLHLLKYKLWIEQQQLCIYSGEKITNEMLFDLDQVQLDYIIPYNRSYNDSIFNKVICLTKEKTLKDFQTPYEYLGNTKKFKTMCKASVVLPVKKAQRLTLKNFSKQLEEDRKYQSLNDQRSIAERIKSHLNGTLLDEELPAVMIHKRNIINTLKSHLGLDEMYIQNDRQHALDAIFTACSLPSFVQDFANWLSTNPQSLKESEQKHAPPLPWPTFKNDLILSVDDVFVSRQPVRKVTGPAHEETIRAIRRSDGKILQRIKLDKVKLTTLDKVVDKHRNQTLINVLRQRLEKYDDDPKKAFAEPVYMPVKSSSKNGPAIKSVRVETNEKSGIEINNGIASNGKMVRVDVYYSKGKYQLIPIYVHHFAQGQLPTKAIMSLRNEDDWLNVRKEEFLFSLYRNDLVRIKNENEDYYAYYVGIHRSVGSMTVRCHDNDVNFGKLGLKESIGVKKLVLLEKYDVNYFGEKYRVSNEKRLEVLNRDSTN